MTVDIEKSRHRDCSKNCNFTERKDNLSRTRLHFIALRQNAHLASRIISVHWRSVYHVSNSTLCQKTQIIRTPAQKKRENTRQSQIATRVSSRRQSRELRSVSKCRIKPTCCRCVRQTLLKKKNEKNKNKYLTSSSRLELRTRYHFIYVTSMTSHSW